MRKKSHIRLAQYIVRNSANFELIKHRKAFYLGSILPDCKPSFLTTKHNIESTLPMVKETIENLISQPNDQYNNRVYIRTLGQILHYLADYFTYPHNDIFPGNLKEHCQYEEDLKHTLKAYVHTEDAVPPHFFPVAFESSDDIVAYIQTMHENYLDSEHCVDNDCRYITQLCYIVAIAIIQLSFQPVPMPLAALA